jgi:CheY-like chemotaxis protein
LLVEDKDDVRLVLERTLVGAGYDVTTANSGDMGFAIFEADPSFDLILTDIVMPGVLQGLDFAKKCRLVRPKTPIVFLSGYSPEATNQGMSSDDIRLMKPVSRSTLLDTVKSCLET